MKNLILKYGLLLLALLLIGCDNDDDGNTPIANGVTINGNFIATPNAYIIFDRSAPYDNGFFFALSNGTLVNDSANNVKASVDTTTAAALLVDNGGTVSTQNLININVSSYPLVNDDTAVLNNITQFNNTYTANGIMYGQIDQGTATEYLIENSGSGSLDVTAITKDFANRSGTITCTFSIIDDNGIVITGSYSGTFEMLNGDT